MILKHYQVDVYVDEQMGLNRFAGDVSHGLAFKQKSLPSKYFYDLTGCALFERITELPEYYLTRAEQDIFMPLVQGLMDQVRPEEIVELGAGSTTKIRWLLNAQNNSEHLRRYIPLDVNEESVNVAARSLTEDYPYLWVQGMVGDFERHLGHVPQPVGRRLVVFFGSTIGNLGSLERRDLLVQIRRLLLPGDRLLLGLDLVKDVGILESAYNDLAGVTEAFNRNILQVVNRLLHANFNLPAFRHYAYYNREASRIEMHLIPTSLQTVKVMDLGVNVQISPYESIWTESSHKFTKESTLEMFSDAGLVLKDWHTNADDQFALALAGPE
jgi:L-histidine N-alpha-methyltransferase